MHCSHAHVRLQCSFCFVRTSVLVFHVCVLGLFLFIVLPVLGMEVVEPWTAPAKCGEFVSLQAGFDPVEAWAPSDSQAGCVSAYLSSAWFLYDAVEPWAAVAPRSLAHRASCEAPAVCATQKADRRAVVKKQLVRSHAGRLMRCKLQEQARQQKLWAVEAAKHLPTCDAVIKFGNKQEHLVGAFRKGAASTLSRHWPGWRRFNMFCAWQEIVPSDASEVEIADFAALFWAAEEEDACAGIVDLPERLLGKGLCSLRSSLAALKFLQARLGIAGWKRALDSGVIKGYEAGAALVAPRRHAPALPLAAIVGFELVLRDRSKPLGMRLVAGFCLLAVWASLRGGDCLSVHPGKLHCEAGILRGFCSSVKVDARGMAFACLCSGLLCPRQAPDWGVEYLCVLRQWQASVPAADWDNVDFLLPAVSPDWELTADIADTVSVGMCLRSLLRVIGVPSPEAYTAHSLKATLLTWARVVLVDGRDMRQQQGHHKLDMAALYARDDTVGALRLQLQVLRALRTGWRPVACHGRGALPPLQEIEVPVSFAEFKVEEFVHLLPVEADWQVLAQQARSALQGCGLSSDESDQQQPVVSADKERPVGGLPAPVCQGMSVSGLFPEMVLKSPRVLPGTIQQVQQRSVSGQDVADSQGKPLCGNFPEVVRGSPCVLPGAIRQVKQRPVSGQEGTASQGMPLSGVFPEVVLGSTFVLPGAIRQVRQRPVSGQETAAVQGMSLKCISLEWGLGPHVLPSFAR